MTFQEYASIGMKSSPKMFEISNGKQHLYYYGASHVNDPEHPMLTHIEEYWGKFLEQIEDKTKSLVIVEGGERNPEGDKETMIRRDAEGGLLTYLAREEGINTFSPEPERTDVDKELLKEFSKEEVQYYYFARIVNQYLKSNPEETFEDYIARFLDKDIKESEWEDFIFTLENMRKIHKDIFNDEFTLEDQGFFFTIINPSRQDTLVNEIARMVSTYRDQYIVERLLEKWNEGLSMFVVYGFTHAYKQEKALKELLK